MSYCVCVASSDFRGTIVRNFGENGDRVQMAPDEVWFWGVLLK